MSDVGLGYTPERTPPEPLPYPYWTVPDRQIETSVVLADTTWRTLNPQ
jgi:hypothetical protein